MGASLEGAVARKPCCDKYHQAVELIGKRWTGAILFVLLDGPARFKEIRALVPDLSDRLLSERLKELEANGIVRRNGGYELTDKGRELEPVIEALQSWANAWVE